MAYILALETATKICSVALFKDDQLIRKKEEGGEYSHAEKLGLFIQTILTESEVSYKDLQAVAISKGPGSYTGLRIGTSTAKGLCYALSIPLISVPSLQAMAHMLQIEENCEQSLLCPMIDARRMEVYTAIYHPDLSVKKEISAEVLDEHSFEQILNKNKICFCGDGSEKARTLLEHHPNAFFSRKGLPSAEAVGLLAFKKFSLGIFEDVAYFEPYYLKDFIAGKAKDLL